MTLDDLHLPALGVKLTRAEVAGSVSAGWPQVSVREVPDVIGWSDFLHDDSLTCDAVRDRASGGCPVLPHVVMYPKDNGKRIITMLDPLDEIAYRALAGRLLDVTDRKLGNEVMASRMLTPPPVWAFGEHHYALANRRRRAELLMDADDFRMVAFYDVRDFFGSIQAKLCPAGLAGLNATGEAEPVAAWVEGLRALWGGKGLPIGPEGSKVVGTAILHPVDSALREAGLSFLRYMDDIHVFHRRSQPEALSRGIVTESLSDLGLEVHAGKLDALGASEVRAVFAKRSEFLEGVVTAGGARAALEFQLELDSPKPAKLRPTLRLAARYPSRELMPLMQANPELVDIAPVEAGLLLERMCIDHRRHVDQDFMLECGVTSKHVGTRAGRLHALRALRRLRLGSECSRSLWTFVESSDDVPLRCFAAEAWAHSSRMKPTMAVELATAVGSPHLRRVLTIGLRRVPPGPKRRKYLDKLHTLGPECRPAARWIEEDPKAPRVA